MDLRTTEKNLLKLVSGRPGPAASQRAHFILSTGRTATNFLAAYLNSSRDVVALHEPPPSWRLRLWSSAYLEGTASRAEMIDVLRATRSSHFFEQQKLDANVYIESNNMLLGFADVIADIFPGARILHVVRDPREYVPSILNHGNTRGMKYLANTCMPFWLPDLRKLYRWSFRPSLFQLFCAYWNTVNEFLNAVQQDKPNMITLRFEDIFSDDASTRATLLSFFDIDETSLDASISLSEPMNRSKDRARAAWQSWPDADCRFLAETCGAMMERYGYGQEPAWRERSGVKR